MSEHITAEELNGGKQHNLKEKGEELKQKALEIQKQLSENLDSLMSSTAKNLDKAAEKIHETAEFFRERDSDTLKKDFSHVVKKHPEKALGGALLIGFLIGKILFK
ncbi:MAG: hypothetical protein WCG23_02680 [bacterium]